MAKRHRFSKNERSRELSVFFLKIFYRKKMAQLFNKHDLQFVSFPIENKFQRVKLWPLFFIKIHMLSYWSSLTSVALAWQHQFQQSARRRKSKGRTPVHWPSTLSYADLSLSIESGCMGLIDKPKFLQLSTDFAPFWPYKTLEKRKVNRSLSKYRAHDLFFPSWPSLNIL